MVYLVLFTLSLGVWAIFYPGFMSGDSLAQFIQAVTGSFDDWHPPILALFLHYIIKLGGGIGTVTLVQVLAGTFGVYFLSLEVIRGYAKSEQDARTIAFWNTIILMSFLSPLSFYLMWFLKDTWLAILMIWVGLFSIKLYRYGPGYPNQRFYAYLIVYNLLITGLLLTRHNVLVVYPVLLLISWLIIRRRIHPVRMSWNYLFLALPLLLFSGFLLGETYFWKVKRVHPGRQVIALEAAGLVVLDSANCKFLPYTCKHLTPRYQEDYIFGEVGSVLVWGTNRVVDDSFDKDDRKLRKQYFRAIRKTPLDLIKVKLLGFWELIKPNRRRYWFHSKIDPNQYGLELNDFFEPVRKAFLESARQFRGIKPFYALTGENFIWILVNVGMIGWILKPGDFFKSRTDKYFTFLLFLVPLIYYSSYLLATTGHDFRFMFPSTLLLQVLLFPFLLLKAKDLKKFRFKFKSAKNTSEP